MIVPTTIYGGDELRRHLADSRVTHAFLTPTTLATLDPGGLDDLECVVTGGEKCTPEVIRRWSPHCRLINAYGPTESTVAADISDDPAADGANVIGGPIRGVTEVVLDARMQPVPIRARGELYIAGDAIARGYHGKPALTATRFVADPFGPPGGRMYRSGDVVRWNTGSERCAVLEYLGRSDSQVKVRGYRIEPGEIDAALSGHPAVTFSATLPSTGGPDTSGQDATLVSYVTTTGAAGPRELRDYLASRLPAQLVPSAVVEIDAIPRTPSGKLDRDALRALRIHPAPRAAVGGHPTRTDRRGNPRRGTRPVESGSGRRLLRSRWRLADGDPGGRPRERDPAHRTSPCAVCSMPPRRVLWRDCSWTTPDRNRAPR